MGCAFCAIVDGEENAVVLDETGETMVFAPLSPVSEGHSLVVPKEHYETLFDIPEPVFHAVVDHAKWTAERLRAGGFDGVNLLHASGRAAQQSIAHFHIHVAPRRTADELDLWPDSEYEESNHDQTYQNVRAVLRNED